MATTYRIRFNNVEEQAVECTLTDETGDLDIVDIEGAEDAVRIVSQDNDENKFSPIKAKKCVIKFFNSTSVNVRTFSEGEDNRWLVTVKINSNIIFVGHLEQGDIEEPFQYQSNQIVTLTATDGLGIIKTHRLEDIYNVWTPDRTNENRIIDYIAACLGATGLRLPINVINNLREETLPVTDTDNYGNIYAVLYLNIKSWEDGKPGRYLNCYDILERILGHDCFVTQAKGEWWIMRVKEYRQDFIQYKTTFDFDGTVLSFTTHNYEKAIGLKDVNNTPFAGTPDASAYFSQDKTVHAFQRPVKYVTLRYKYENPLEILCNGTFQRGDFIADLPDEVDADGFTQTAKSYEIDCWDYEKAFPFTTTDSTAYIKRLFSLGQEKQRFVHLEPTATNSPYYLVSAEQIPVNLYDRFTLSFTVRYSTDFGSPTGHFEHFEAWVRLFANDGTFWSLNCVNGPDASDPSTYWKETASDWIGSRVCYHAGEASQVDFTQWINLSFESTPIPRSGKLEIILINVDVPSTRSKDFGAVNFEYIPYINGSYETFASQSDTSTRDGIYFASIEEDVYISNSPNPIFKGALLKQGDSGFVGVGRFYDGQEFLNEVDGLNHLASYGQHRVQAFHNQYRNANEIYRMTCQGLGAGGVDGDGFDDHQDLIHRIFNRDIEPATNNRAFQLVNQDLDLRNCEWTGTMIENFNQDIGFVTDDYDFEYETPEDLGETTHHGNVPGEEPGPTPGDDIEAAIELVGETWSVTGNNSLATTQAIDNSENTIWYKWAAPLDGRININTSGSSFNTTIRVGTWDGVTFTELGYNDDAIGTGSDLSSVDIEVTQGVEYYFAIGGPTVTDLGDYVFNMDLDSAFTSSSGSGSGSGGGINDRFGVAGEDDTAREDRNFDSGPFSVNIASSVAQNPQFGVGVGYGILAADQIIGAGPDNVIADIYANTTVAPDTGSIRIRTQIPGNSYAGIDLLAGSTGSDDGTVFIQGIGGIALSGVLNSQAINVAYTKQIVNYLVGDSDYFIECAGTFNVTFKSCSGRTGRMLVIKNSGVGVITVLPDGTDTIDGGASVTLNSLQSLTVICDGVSNWNIIS